MNDKFTAPPIEKTNIVWLVFLVAITIILCIAFTTQAPSQTAPQLFDEANIVGTVKSVRWQRKILIEEWGKKIVEDWRDKVPAGTAPLSCTEKLRDAVREAYPPELVCNRERSGRYTYRKVCHYETRYYTRAVFDDYCKYPTQGWKEVDAAWSEGNDMKPFWPQIKLNAEQHEGEHQSFYTIMFETLRGIKEYETSDDRLFEQAKIGSKWTLNIKFRTNMQEDKIQYIIRESK